MPEIVVWLHTGRAYRLYSPVSKALYSWWRCAERLPHTLSKILHF